MAKKPASETATEASLEPAGGRPRPGGEDPAFPRRARDNPFRVARQEALIFRFPSGGWPALEAALERHGGRGALVGPKGTGKTTLLHELEERFGDLGWGIRRLRLTREGPRPSADERRLLTHDLGPRDLLTVDGAEQISRPAFWHLRWLARRAGALVITTHRPGRLPTLLETRTSPTLLVELVRELAPDHLARLEPQLHALFERHRGNLRECLRELYDGWSSGKPGGVGRSRQDAGAP